MPHLERNNERHKTCNQNPTHQNPIKSPLPVGFKRAFFRNVEQGQTAHLPSLAHPPPREQAVLDLYLTPKPLVSWRTRTYKLLWWTTGPECVRPVSLVMMRHVRCSLLSLGARSTLVSWWVYGSYSVLHCVVESFLPWLSTWITPLQGSSKTCSLIHRLEATALTRWPPLNSWLAQHLQSPIFLCSIGANRPLQGQVVSMHSVSRMEMSTRHVV